MREKKEKNRVCVNHTRRVFTVTGKHKKRKEQKKKTYGERERERAKEVIKTDLCAAFLFFYRLFI